MPATENVFALIEEHHPTLATSRGAMAALRSIHAGRNCVLSSPPGAGKTEVVTTLAPILARAKEARVHIITPTINGAYDVARRLEKISLRLGVPIYVSGSSLKPRGASLALPSRTQEPGSICVRTIASARIARPDCDIMIVDEAYQATAVDVFLASLNAGQILCVGDPGQIGPVTTFDTSAWDSEHGNPAQAAPKSMVSLDGVDHHALDTSFRLGEESCELVAPLYSFPFTSGRGEKPLSGHHEIESFFYAPTSPMDEGFLRACVQRARELSHITFENGDRASVAVIASRNEQIGFCHSLLPNSSIVIGTADSLQGAQFDAVVAIDPLAGADHVSEHATELGRLCVMLTRHLRHLSWMSDTAWEARLADKDDLDGFDIHRAVRSHLATYTKEA